jgi:hypothetical protein
MPAIITVSFAPETSEEDRQWFWKRASSLDDIASVNSHSGGMAIFATKPTRPHPDVVSEIKAMCPIGAECSYLLLSV